MFSRLRPLHKPEKLKTVVYYVPLFKSALGKGKLQRSLADEVYWLYTSLTAGVSVAIVQHVCVTIKLLYVY